MKFCKLSILPFLSPKSFDKPSSADSSHFSFDVSPLSLRSESSPSPSISLAFRIFELVKNKERELMVPPRVFVKGRYVGGAEEVLKFVEEGWFGDLLEEIPKRKAEGACEGCGDVRFLPCFQCNGSCKTVINVKEETGRKLGTTVVVRCSQCNENGDELVSFGGLQVRKNGEWIPVTPAQDTLVVNLGNVIQVLSNNKFRSATHRVVCILL